MRDTLPFLIPIIISLGLFAMIGWIIWVESRRRQAQSQAAAEVDLKLLEKFTSSQELVDFLQTEEGKLFLISASGPQSNPLERVLRSIKYGVVLTIFGAGWLVLGLTDRFNDEGALTFIGFLFESVGIGFLASAAITHYFSRKWGFYSGPNPPRADVFVSAREKSS